MDHLRAPKKSHTLKNQHKKRYNHTMENTQLINLIIKSVIQNLKDNTTGFIKIDHKEKTILGYPQTSYFTCGPAALLTAMKNLNKKINLTPLDEFLIWKEANTIFMGEGHPGCGTYGLGCSSIKRGFNTEIYTNVKTNELLFDDCITDKQEKNVYKQMEEEDRRAYVEAGGIIHFKKIAAKTIQKKLNNSHLALTLIDDPHIKNGAHWVTLITSNEDTITCFNPYAEKEFLTSIKTKDFDNYFSYGKNKKQAFLLLNNK